MRQREDAIASGNYSEALAALISAGTVPAWSSGLTFWRTEDDGTYVLRTRNRVAYSMATSQGGAGVMRLLADATSEATGAKVVLRVVMSDEPPPRDLEDASDPDPRPPRETAREPAGMAWSPPDRTVIGDWNRVAYAAVDASARGASPGSPLVIWGDSGLGKTRLLRHAGAALQGSVSLTCEEFTNGFIDALRDGDLGSFRKGLRSARAVILDDLQFAVGKPRMQEELALMIEAVSSRCGTVVAATTDAPRSIRGFAPRLASWLAGGFVTAISRPARADRIQLIAAKAEAKRIEIPPEVAGAMADAMDGSIREIEGAVNRLAASASIAGRGLDLASARSAISDVLCRDVGPRTLEEIASAVASRFGVSEAQIRGPSRKKREATARQAFMWLATRLTDSTLTRIGEWCGGRDHTTVIYSVGRVADDADGRTRNDALALEAEIKRVPAGDRRDRMRACPA